MAGFAVRASGIWWLTAEAAHNHLEGIKGTEEACYGIAKELAEEGKKRLEEDMLSVLNRFYGLVAGGVE